MSDKFATVAKLLTGFQEAEIGDGDLARIVDDPELLGEVIALMKKLSAEKMAKIRQLSSVRSSSLDVMAEELPAITAKLKRVGYSRIFHLTAETNARFVVVVLEPEELQQVAEWLAARGLKVGASMVA